MSGRILLWAHFKVRFKTHDGGSAPYEGKNHISQTSEKKNILKKGFLHYFSTTINIFNLFFYNEKKEILLKKKFILCLIIVIFSQKRNKRTTGQVVVIFIFKKQGMTKRKFSGGKNLMNSLTHSLWLLKP